MRYYLKHQLDQIFHTVYYIAVNKLKVAGRELCDVFQNGGSYLIIHIDPGSVNINEGSNFVSTGPISSSLAPRVGE